jgi:hypothetical protein
MADIARQAGVSRVAVSYALNGRPGVSDELRERILHIAQEVGFSANGPAQVMHGATVRAIGLTMRRPSAVYQVEVFRRELISGVQAELMTHHLGLALQFVGDVDEELAVYRRWSAERRVGGVLVCDLAVDDPRVGALRDMQLPAVVIGGPVPGDALASIWCDDAPAIEQSEPNSSAHAHKQAPQHAEPTLALDGAADRYDHRVDEDYYSQPGALFRLMSPEQQRLLVDNIVGAMGSVSRDVQLRQIGHFFKADPAYGEGVARGLGIEPSEVM